MLLDLSLILIVVFALLAFSGGIFFAARVEGATTRNALMQSALWSSGTVLLVTLLYVPLMWLGKVLASML